MKNKLLLLVVILMIMFLGSIVYSSCTKDPCSGVTCLNGGACGGGTCDCPVGYSGTQCQTPFNETVAGRYTGTDCDGSASYTITAGNAPSGIQMELAVTGGSCATTLYLHGTADATSDVLVFPSTVYYDGCGNSIVIGISGAVNNNSITLNFNVGYQGTVTTCVFSGTKN